MRFTLETPRVLLNFSDAAWDEVVRARAEAAQQHYGLLLNLCHMTHAAGRQARGRPDKRRRGGSECEDELHGIKLVRLAASRLEAPRRAGRRGLLAETH